MTNRIKVVPNTPDAIGMRHPLDGALAPEGSLWAYDTFTLQRMHAGSIRHAEEGRPEQGEETPAAANLEGEVKSQVEAKPSKAAKAAAAAANAAG